MDLWQLHIFCKVVETKSFSEAGESARLSQPTVSNHIKALEEHLGCRLIDRLAKEALPTEAGRLLYGYARKMLALRDETESALAAFLGKMTGRLVIGGSTIPGVYILPQIIGAFKRKFPHTMISLVIGDTQKIVRETLSGELELGIVGAKTDEKRIFQEELIRDEMRLIVPGDHPWARRKTITVEMLLKEPFIARERGSGTLRSIDESLSQKGIRMADLSVVACMGSTEAVIQGIKGRVGVSILSTIAVSEELAAGRLKALAVDGLDLTRHFYLTRDKDRSASPLGSAFLTFLSDSLAKAPYDPQTH